MRNTKERVSFIGAVRNHARGHSIEYLEYEAYPEMAEREMEKIADEAGENLEERGETLPPHIDMEIFDICRQNPDEPARRRYRRP